MLHWTRRATTLSVIVAVLWSGATASAVQERPRKPPVKHEGQGKDKGKDSVLDKLPPAVREAVQKRLAAMPPEQRERVLQAIRSVPPDRLRQLLGRILERWKQQPGQKPPQTAAGAAKGKQVPQAKHGPAPKAEARLKVKANAKRGKAAKGAERPDKKRLRVKSREKANQAARKFTHESARKGHKGGKPSIQKQRRHPSARRLARPRPGRQFQHAPRNGRHGRSEREQEGFFLPRRAAEHLDRLPPQVKERLHRAFDRLPSAMKSRIHQGLKRFHQAMEQRGPRHQEGVGGKRNDRNGGDLRRGGPRRGPAGPQARNAQRRPHGRPVPPPRVQGRPHGRPAPQGGAPHRPHGQSRPHGPSGRIL
ncbi:MAG: hypothetical protein HYZ53_06825 [Planctomycetes bacterium]|nr:hypothetical protein [Planctomycetota bacterium]